MSENKCGDCRHWKEVHGIWVTIGTCEREDWTDPGIEPRPFETPRSLHETHHRHVLSADHPSPPCFEGKAKRARLVSTKCSCRTPAKCTCLKAAQNASFTALDDIKKGEAVVIVK
jgi:hypothetical protein